MDVYANSSGLQNIVGYGSHSVVVSHHPNNYYHYHPVSTQPLTKSTSAYQLVPFMPVERTAILVPVQQQKQKQQPRQTRPAQGKYKIFCFYCSKSVFSSYTGPISCRTICSK